jgi:Ca-activated chloride channel family protein
MTGRLAVGWIARNVITFAIIVAFAPIGAARHQNPQDPPAFKGGASDVVVVPVTVTDKEGRLIPDLQRDAFAVYDNDRRQEIAFFAHEDTPVSVALVIDSSGSMRPKVGEVIAATLAFARASHPEDELLVIEFNERVRDALGGRRLSAGDAAELETTLHALRPDGQTALYNALLDGLDHLEHASRSRRVMVLVSDGGDNASSTTFDEVLARARRSDVTIYTIGLFEDGGHDTNPGVLKRLAAATGGARFLPRSPGYLLQACEQIAREIRTSYTLGYVATERDGAYHRLKVVLGPGARGNVRTRPGYFAGPGSTR